MMLPDHDGVRRELVAFLQSIARPGFDLAQLSDDADLLDRGALDSLAIVLVIQYLEEAYDIDWSDSRVDPAQLTSVAQILRIIAAART